ncbi:MAG TPA: M20 family metallopeptidase [bacterium]|nr:M20 family metallopeptidase [bacterium]
MVTAGALPDVQALKARALAALDTVAEEARDLALRIHANPEIGFQEVRAVEWVGDALRRHGYDVERGAADLPTAVIARAVGNGPGPTVGLIAEYDALPGLGHACGHNLMAAGMMAAAAALRAVLADLPGQVVYYGTPAEEGGGGKILMLERGAFRGLDVALAYHAGATPHVTTGCLAVQRVDFAFTGRPSHAAAAPWSGLNALDAVILTFNAVGALRQQIRPDSRVHGIVTDGGQAVNIIPEHAAMALGVRSPDGAYVRELVERVKACARGAAQATATALEVTLDLFLDAIRYNPALADLVQRNARALGFDMAEETSGASTDLGNLTQAVPTIEYTLPTCPPGVGMHTREALEAGKAEIGLAGMLNDARVMAMTAIDLLADREAVARARRDFEAGNFSGGSGA